MDKAVDLTINCRVRRALVRHWIDLGKISVRTTCGVVWLSGSLDRLPNSGTDLDTKAVESVLAEIKRVPDVRRIQSNFDNWRERTGSWIEAEGKRVS